MAEKITAYRFDRLDQTLTQLNKENCVIIAGGTDVMVLHKSRRGVPPKIPKPIVFIDHLSELKRIYQNHKDLHIGACCTYSDLLEDPFIPIPLKKAIKTIAAPAIRNRGTLGGNICNASPAGDTLPLLYVYNAKLLLRSVHGDRVVAINDFIQGPRRVQRHYNEMLVEIILPSVLEEGSHIVFEKIGNRNADAIAKVSFAGYIRINGVRIEDVRFAFGAVGPTIVRSIDIEKKLYGLTIPLTEADIAQIVAAFDKIINPIDDQRSTAIYRKTVALNLLRYFLCMKQYQSN
ncbi:FAD binding domain-containing protein [Metabacillus sediminilitoris]|uniref:Xanthine dehydrogenase family protein subunit M n=1 Tax=Metabacillus sediminilitoris TaxID=2567941 RepID=A0A4S4BP03_9BACI|nr:FAD binding domain-containing protein [Metabacillus sediminilitoris]QGQ45553.1 xanthine dehydrogenase family protein subunit M [Metabacillus sediminilitoris]THF76618.1 xanthine dehydrogenase family protein subunit M [Metabacillus sediminilitoris]